MKKYFDFATLFAFVMLFASSCNNEMDTVSPDDNTGNDYYEVYLVDDEGSKTLIESSNPANLLNALDVDSDNGKDQVLLIDEEGNEIVLNSSEKNALLNNGLNSEDNMLRSSRGFYGATKTGYATKRKIGGSKVSFAGYNPEYPRLDGTCVGDVYEFSFQVTVPANASLMIPGIDDQIKTHMGFSSFDGKKFGKTGYRSDLISSNSSRKIYKISTVALEITHNMLGQQVTPVLYSKEAKQPNLYYFEYFWNVR